MAARQLSDNRGSGVCIGQSSTDLVAFHGATAVDQYALITAVATNAATSTIGTQLNAVLTLLSEKGLMASS